MTTIFKDINMVKDRLKISEIQTQRIQKINVIREELIQRLKQDQKIDLVFICTHNSRRSIFSQIWAHTIAKHYGYDSINTYSGGTQSTEIYKSVISMLRANGFIIEKTAKQVNPEYQIKYAENEAPITCFSKTFDSPINPQTDFYAIMTCSDADENCPFVSGAKSKFSLNYEDPKLFDNTSQEASKYLERSIQIATEMKYLFLDLY